jgi:hypothetical protein
VRHVDGSAEPQFFAGVNAYSALAFSPDGMFLLCGPHSMFPNSSRGVAVLDLETGAEGKYRGR